MIKSVVNVFETKILKMNEANLALLRKLDRKLEVLKTLGYVDIAEINDVREATPTVRKSKGKNVRFQVGRSFLQMVDKHENGESDDDVESNHRGRESILNSLDPGRIEEQKYFQIKK
jgi:hypothetical protein